MKCGEKGNTQLPEFPHIYTSLNGCPHLQASIGLTSLSGGDTVVREATRLETTDLFYPCLEALALMNIQIPFVAC